MTNVLLLGAGTIGRMIAALLTQSGDYRVRVADTDAAALERLKAKLGVETMVADAANETDLAAAMNGQTAVISALTFALNPRAWNLAIYIQYSSEHTIEQRRHWPEHRKQRSLLSIC